MAGFESLEAIAACGVRCNYGDTFNGSGVDFAKDGIEYFSGPTTRLYL
jgi:hypothetical protein